MDFMNSTLSSSTLNLWDEEKKEKRHLMDSNTRGVKKENKN
jgi:hypothetical protein